MGFELLFHPLLEDFKDSSVYLILEEADSYLFSVSIAKTFDQVEVFFVVPVWVEHSLRLYVLLEDAWAFFIFLEVEDFSQFSLELCILLDQLLQLSED